MANKLAQLKEKLKKAAVVSGNIVIIEKGVLRFRCQNSFHGKREMVYHQFIPPRITELECDCGTIYKMGG